MFSLTPSALLPLLILFAHKLSTGYRHNPKPRFNGKQDNTHSSNSVTMKELANQLMSNVVQRAMDAPEILKLYELPPHYNKWELPIVRRNVTNGVYNFIKLPIRVEVLIAGFRGINELKEQVTVELDLIVRWIDFLIRKFDKRTQAQIYRDNGAPYISLDSSFLDKIWWPTIMFTDIVSVIHPNLHPTIYPKPVQLRIYAEGKIRMTSRLVLKLHCPMNFKYYPADTQTCKFRIRSYPFSENDIKLEWQPALGNEEKADGPYALYLEDRDDSSFYTYLHSVGTTNYTPRIQSATAENYTILEFSVSAKRKLNFHIMQTFVPSGFLILITWLSFLLPTALLEARIGITMTTLLTLTAMFSSIKEFTPQVSYVKAIDIWMLVCIIVVFISLFEFALLIWLRMVMEKNMKMETQDRDTMLNKAIVKVRPSWRHTIMETEPNKEKDKNEEKKRIIIYQKVMEVAEQWGFLIISGSFLGFNVIYWPWLLVSSDHFQSDVNSAYNAPDP